MVQQQLEYMTHDAFILVCIDFGYTSVSKIS